MSLRTRLALAFALVAAVVAGLVGVLSHRAASERITDETDRSLSSATTALLEGQTAVLSALPPSAPTDRDGLDGNGPGRPDPRGEGPAFVAQQIAPDGTVTFLGGRPVRLPVDPATRALAAYGRTGQVATQEIELGRGAYRVRTTALGDGHGAVQVGLDIDQSRRVLGGLATEIAIISAVVTVVAAGAGWLLARRITRRLVRLASTAEDIADHGRIEVDVPVEGRDEVGRLAGSFTTMFARLAAARDAQDRLVQDAAQRWATCSRTRSSSTPTAPTTSSSACGGATSSSGSSPRRESAARRSGAGRSRWSAGWSAACGARRSRAPRRPRTRDPSSSTVMRRPLRRCTRAAARGPPRPAPVSLPTSRERPVSSPTWSTSSSSWRAPPPPRAGTTTVTDQGPGIAPGDAARVFDRFYRADSARALPGSGLGLAIVRDVAEGHGGGAFTTTPPGGGTTVGFSSPPTGSCPRPARPPRPDPTPRAGTSRPDRPPLTGLRIRSRRRFTPRDHRGLVTATLDRSPSRRAPTPRRAGVPSATHDRRVRTAVEALLAASLTVVTLWWASGGGLGGLGGWASGLDSLGRLTGLLASVLLLVQVILMARVPVLEQAFGQDRLARIHRLVGFTSFTGMLAHIGLITWGYAAGDLARVPAEAWDLTVDYPGMLLAVAGTACLVMVVVTSVRAARARLRYESWHPSPSSTTEVTTRR